MRGAVVASSGRPRAIDPTTMPYTSPDLEFSPPQRIGRAMLRPLAALLGPFTGLLGVASSAVAQAEPVVVRIQATIDGSERLRCDAQGLHWDHLFWHAPTGVTVNGLAWDPISSPFLPWDSGLVAEPNWYDFAAARLRIETARDVVGRTPIRGGVMLEIADVPGGPEHYALVLEIPAKAAVAPPPKRRGGAPAELVFRAWIDGSDVLVIRHDSLSWRTRHFRAPHLPVLCDDRPWNVAQEPDLRFQVLDPSVDLATARAVRIRGRDAVAVEPHEDHVLVRFGDNFPGADYYELRLRFGPEPAPAPGGAEHPTAEPLPREAREGRRLHDPARVPANGR